MNWNKSWCFYLTMEILTFFLYCQRLVFILSQLFEPHVKTFGRQFVTIKFITYLNEITI